MWITIVVEFIHRDNGSRYRKGNTVKRVSQEQAVLEIAKVREFNSGNLTGVKNFRGWGEHTIFHGDDVQILIKAVHAVYWVYSFDTPMAFITDIGEWWVNGKKYSQSTTKHQSIVRRGLDEYRMRQYFLNDTETACV